MTVAFARARRVVGSDRAHVVVEARSLMVIAGCVAVVAALLLVTLGSGDFEVAPADVIGAFTGSTDGIARTVVLEWRLPRAAAAVVFGAALAISGAIFQSVTRNPLASPDVIGLANGSFTGMLIALLFFGGAWQLLIAGSLVGGLVVAVAIAVLAARDGLQGFRFVVIGVGVSAMLAALNTWLLLRAELETALFAAAWGAGSLNSVSDETAWPAIAVLTALLLAITPCVVRPLRQLDLGEDVARASGVEVRRSRWWLIGVAVAMVSVVTAIAGPIAFVALAAPQIARRLAGTASIPLGPSAAVGAALLLASDVIAQHVIPLTVPVGVVTVATGGAYLVWLLAREIRRSA